jgi:hypothetical protein
MLQNSIYRFDKVQADTKYKEQADDMLAELIKIYKILLNN